MKPKISVVFLIAMVAIIYSCTSSKALYEKGNYYEAVMRSVEKLRKNPKNKNAREALANAYPMAISTFMDQLENDDAANKKFKFTEAVVIYNQLNGMYESIQRSPGAQEVIRNPKKYYQTLERIKPAAAEEQYMAGLELLSYPNRETAKQAYKHFLKADQLVPGYRDIGMKIEEAYQRSILHVIADLKPVHSRMYELSSEIFYREIENTLKQIENNEFIRFYTPEEAANIGLQQADQVLEINFEDFVVGETHTKETIQTMKQDSVIVGEVTLDNGSKKEVLGEVEADISVYHMENISRGLVHLSITKNDINDKELLFRDFPGEFIWFHEWGTYKGDKRALNDEQLAICDRQMISPPAPQQLFVEFSKPIHQQLHSSLLSFYRNY